MRRTHRDFSIQRLRENLQGVDNGDAAVPVQVGMHRVEIRLRRAAEIGKRADDIAQRRRPVKIRVPARQPRPKAGIRLDKTRGGGRAGLPCGRGKGHGQLGA